MATSGTYTFTITRDAIISAALRTIGVLDPEGGTATATQITNAAETLNLLVKSWAAKGLHLWTRRLITITLVADTLTYNLGASTATTRPLRVLDGYIRSSAGNDIPMRIISREEYNRFGVKNANGTTVQVYYDPQLENGVVYVYPVTATTTGTLYLEVEYPLMDFSASGDTPDFPQEWFNALKWNLAAELAVEYGVNNTRLGMVGNKAAAELDSVSDFDTEYGNSTYFTPQYNG